MKNFNILFLGGAKRVSLAERFVLAGLELGLKVNVFSYELDVKVPFSIVGDVIKGKLWEDGDIYDDLIDIIEKKGILIVLANVDSATLVLAELNEKHPHLGLITSRKSLCNIFLDKLKAQKQCEKVGIKIVPLSNVEFPMILKPRKGSASKGICVANDATDLDYILTQIDEKDYIKQNYIDGTEYTVDAYVSKNGQFIGAIPRIRYDVTAGESTTAIIVHDTEISQVTKEIIEKFELKGPITLQFIRKNKELYFLELNPRFGGGIIASIEAGFNIPKMMIQDYLDIPFNKLTNYKPIIATRYYREVFHAVNN